MSFLLLLNWLLIAPQAQAVGKQHETEQQLKQLKQRISVLQQELRQQEGESRQLSRTLRESEVTIGRVAKQIQKLDKQLTGLDQRAADLEVKRDRLKAQLQKRAEIIENQMAQQYRMGKQPRLQLLLTERDPESLDRTIRYFDFVNEALQQDIQRFQDKLAELGKTESDLSDTERLMVEKRNRLKAELATLEVSRKQRTITLAALKKTLSGDRSRLKQLKLDQKRLHAVLSEIEKSLNFASLVKENKPIRSLKGRLAWPLKGKVRRSFGSVIDGIRYDGIWIKAGEATPVKAVHHGRVVFADWLRGYGLVMIIDHGKNYLTLYGYNQSLLFETGDWVSAGDTIATVGNSGGRNENGLYFALRYKGKAYNPRPWLKR